MRAALLAVIIFAALPFILRHPVLGAYLWAWVSMMNPHRYVYGLESIGFAQVIAIATMLALVFTRQRRAFPLNSITVVWILFVAWMSFTSLFALNSSDLVLERWISVMKIHVMIAVTLMLILSRSHLEGLIWVATFSLAVYGIKGGIWTVLSGGTDRVFGPPGSMVADNNALSVALVMLVPFLYYLWQVSNRKAVRWFILFAIATNCFAILGSQSRGALVAVLAMATFLGMKSRHPVRMSVAIGTLLVLAVLFMPDSWTLRMNTIREYQADDSAMSRIYTWKTLWNLALDHPFVGGGFRSDSAMVFALYAPTGAEFDVFRGSDSAVWVAHSIYFQTLGEHGFVGLGLFLTLGVLTWRRAAKLAKMTQGDPDFGDWVPKLMPMIQVSLIGYAVGGAFLSLAYFDWPYYVVGYVALVDAMVRSRQKGRVASAAGAGAGGAKTSARQPTLKQS
jgi:putative inorganic carbon (HCO3(-)) transporter